MSSIAQLAEIRDLSILYEDQGKQVIGLSDISLSLLRGEKLTLIGESGSGKSTFGRALGDLLPANARMSGQIDWTGFASRPLRGADIGYVFQNASGSLDPVMSIGRQIAEICQTHLGMDRKAAILEAIKLIERVRLPEPERIASAYPHQLSGGQRQRAAIAAAIAGRPQILIADEATSALDMIVQAEIIALIQTLVDEDQMSLIFISHDIALVSNFADRIAVFRQGSLVEIGTAQEIISAPKAAYTQSLIDAHRGLDQ